MSLLMVGAGVPARGEGPRPPPTTQYKHLSEQQRQKLKAALETAQQDARLLQPEGCLRTEVTFCLYKDLVFLIYAPATVFIILESDRPCMSLCSFDSSQLPLKDCL